MSGPSATHGCSKVPSGSKRLLPDYVQVQNLKQGRARQLQQICPTSCTLHSGSCWCAAREIPTGSLAHAKLLAIQILFPQLTHEGLAFSFFLWGIGLEQPHFSVAAALQMQHRDTSSQQNRASAASHASMFPRTTCQQSATTALPLARTGTYPVSYSLRTIVSYFGPVIDDAFTVTHAFALARLLASCLMGYQGRLASTACSHSHIFVRAVSRFLSLVQVLKKASGPPMLGPVYLFCFFFY